MILDWSSTMDILAMAEYIYNHLWSTGKFKNVVLAGKQTNVRRVL